MIFSYILPDNEGTWFSQYCTPKRRIIAKNEGIELIKRIAGVPGDTVEFKDNTLYVNDEEVKFYDYHGIKAKKFDKVTLKKDQYLIIGDNFKKSYDGRYFGPINKKQIQGIVR